MQVPKIDQDLKDLFVAEQNFHTAVFLLYDNRRRTRECERSLQTTRHRLQNGATPRQSEAVERIYLLQLNHDAREWVRLYLRRKAILKRFADADRQLRRIQDDLQ